MAIDQIWKQQLTLVTYGNEYLSQDLSFNRWLQHSIFNQHQFAFRDLISQHLLAQHFQVWLEGLKKQGVQRLSLHRSTLLEDEQNPNANVELLPFEYFIVSHEAQKKNAWIIGKELPEWYTADNDYEAPATQRSSLRHETFWQYELNSKLARRVLADLEQPNWDDIQVFMDHELFDTRFAQGFVQPAQLGQPYYGVSSTTDTGIGSKLALLPTDYAADFAHDMLYRLDALEQLIEAKIQHPYHENGEVLTPDQQLDLRHFAQKLDDLKAKFIVKIANHYKTAKLSPKISADPFAGMNTEEHVTKLSKSHKPHDTAKSNSGNVITLIIITVIICLIGYYFGL
ncbi:glutamine synthetase [Acinetobacter sp. ASP199]|uniref:glutamine synthetase n=1 Tax=unclassified Acinetobacter TaxID=196816 RepID=UPI001F61CED1|nr:glutamine synthetase [Acinetobacter sp. ASP199]UNT59766.1 hypothetical protein IHE35_02710 [Acinetobacter sp. ASP199]